MTKFQPITLVKAIKKIKKCKSGRNSCYDHCSKGSVDSKIELINNDILHNETTKWRIKEKIFNSIKVKLLEREKTLHSTCEKLELQMIEQFGSEDVPICEVCFVSLYNMTDRTYERLKKLEKTRAIMGSHTEQIQKLVTIQNKQSNVMNERAFRNLPEARKFFNNNSVIKLSEFEIKSLCIPPTFAAVECLSFLNDFFDLNCDYPPNKNDTTCELSGSMYTKKSIYNIFVNHCKKNSSRESEYYSYSSFRKMWRNVFPNVTIKKYLSVASKCDDCFYIYKLEEEATNNKQREEIQLLKHYHRLFVMQQKLQYYENRRLRLLIFNTYNY